MNVLIINGSPKGQNSTTLFNSLYIEKIYSEHFDIINIGPNPKKYIDNTDKLTEKIRQSDLIIFSYPVYTFLVPAQLHAIIEKLYENDAFYEKFVTQITTSKHFFDTTAHRFIEDNMKDMGAKYIKGLSLDMEDLLSENGRFQLTNFYKFLKFSVQNDIYEHATEKKLIIPEKYTNTCNIAKKENKFKAVIVSDCSNTNICEMIETFRNSFKYNTELVNLKDINIKGGCLGCLKCAISGNCIYRDDFQDILNNRINKADLIVYATEIRNHSMGSLMKIYDDRQFCNGHRTVTAGIPVAYLLSGNYSAEENLRTVIEARADVGGNFLAGVATDETNPEKELSVLAKKCEFALETGIIPAKSFYNAGGMKIFRDMIYVMQGFMKKDHLFYKNNGLYDFPQKEKGKILKMKFAGLVMSSPRIRAKLADRLDEIIISPYKKIIEDARPLD